MSHTYRLTDAELITVTESPEPVSLPEGFGYVERADISIDQIIDLRESEGWYGDTPGGWQPIIDGSLIVFAVSKAAEGLVGMGRVTGDTRHATFCDFVVDTNYQRHGIGTAILLERMRRAKQLGVIYSYAEIKETNPLRRTYEQLGFTATGNGLFRVEPE